VLDGGEMKTDVVYKAFFVKRKCPRCGYEWEEDLNAPKTIPANANAVNENGNLIQIGWDGGMKTEIDKRNKGAKNLGDRMKIVVDEEAVVDGEVQEIVLKRDDEEGYLRICYDNGLEILRLNLDSVEEVMK